MTGRWVELALGQAGAISVRQLAECGESDYTTKRLVATGVLLRASRGVYTMVGSAGSWKQELWMGLLAAGPTAFAYRRSAAALWTLDGVEPGAVEVAVGGGHAPRRPGTARLRSLRPNEVTVLDGIRLTTVPRTLVDLASSVAPSAVERSLECALRRGLVTPAWVQDPDASPRSPGGRALREILATRPVGGRPTESDAETLFVQVVRQAGLPAPDRQVEIVLGGRRYRMDFAWPRLRLAVEIDGASVHGPGQLGADLRRQNHMILDRWMILRFTWHMVAREPAGVARMVRDAWNMRLIEPAGAV
jgi:very-short-patch-repair endonuclease